jgi:hypothetical protein
VAISRLRRTAGIVRSKASRRSPSVHTGQGSSADTRWSCGINTPQQDDINAANFIY